MARPPRVDVLIDPEDGGTAAGGRGSSSGGGGGGAAYYNNSRRWAPTALDTNILIVTSSLFAVLILALCMHFAIRWALSHFYSPAHPTPPPPPPPPPPPDSAPPSTGLHKLHVDSLPSQLYSQNAEVSLFLDATSSSSSSQCPICLSDFADGERIRVLPGCHHGFHVICIDTWLAKQTSCPTCRGNLMDALTKESHVRLHILIGPTTS